MSEEENRGKVRAFYEQAINKGNLAAVDDLVAPGEISHGAGGTIGTNTPASVKKWVADLRLAFPDIQVTVEDVIAEGGKVVNCVAYRGTQTAAWNDPVWGWIPPTGRRMEWTAIAINRFAGGKSAEAWDLIDELSFLQQLGVVPTPTRIQR